MKVSGYPATLVRVSYAASVRRCSLHIVVAVTVFVVNSMAILMAVGVRMTLTLCVIRTSSLGGCMTQRYSWE